MVCSFPCSPPQHDESHAGAHVCGHPPIQAAPAGAPPTRRFWSRSARRRKIMLVMKVE